MKPPAGQLLILLLLILTLPAVGQRNQQPIFRAIVHLKDGGRVSGVLDDVGDGVIEFVPYERTYYRHVEIRSAMVPLSDVDWIVLKRADKRQAIRTGIVVGGLLGGYLAYQSTQKNGFRSPILGAVSIALSAGSVGMAGALVGSLVGGANRRTIRPFGDNPTENLERQLRPFTKVYLDNMRFDQRNPAATSPR